MAEGISFVIRARNEEATLEKSIRSLFALTIPYEIVVVLHLCTDRSKEIVEALQRENDKIHIYEFDVEVSKPGYETLATDVNSDHSFVRYSNWCIQKATLPWIFRWDADFAASEGLLRFLNDREWPRTYGQYFIEARNSTHNNRELYLICGLCNYSKYLFWEVPYYISYTGSSPSSVPDDVFIQHASELSEVKQFWKRIPWYETEDSEEARTVKERIARLTADFGEEPKAMARAGYTACDPLQYAILKASPDYVRIRE
jgi:glycosyltransferase involved in cell wall biosynthesis